MFRQNQRKRSDNWSSGLTVQTKILVFVAFVAVIVSAGILVEMYATSTTSNSVDLNQSSTVTSSLSSPSSNDSLVGYQIGYSPQGAWTKYIGYIPSGYKIAPREPDAPVFPCPSGMSSAECQTFQQSCGNGVCDPNERCDTCPLDCPVSGALTCDPYTGRTGSPASVCQINQQQQQAQLPG